MYVIVTALRLSNQAYRPNDDDADTRVIGSILRYVRDCTSLKLDGGESCKTNEGASQSQLDTAASGKDHQSQQPAKSCVWTCDWDGCNDGPLSSSTRSQQSRQLLQLVAVSLVISVVVVTSSLSSFAAV